MINRRSWIWKIGVGLLFSQLLLGCMGQQKATTKDLLHSMKAKNDQQWYQHFTFKQATLRFDTNGVQTDSSVWYEAVSYPYYFRIDRDTTEKNYVIYRNDSTYQFRQDTLYAALDQPATHLLFKGGVYWISVEESLQKLTQYGYDVQTFRRDTFQGEPVYVVGKPDMQFWLHANHYYCMRRIYSTSSGKLVDVVYSDFTRLGGGWVEQQVTFYVDGTKRLEEFYFDIKTRDHIDTRTYDPNRKFKWYLDY